MKKSLIVVVLGCVIGFAWAYVDTHPEILEYLSLKKKEITDKIPNRIERPETQRDSITDQGKSDQPSPPPNLPPDPVDDLILPVRKMISEGKLTEAEDEIKRLRAKEGISPVAVAKLNVLQMDLDHYKELIRESSIGRLLATPSLTKLDMKDGKTCYAHLTGKPESKLFQGTDIGGNLFIARKEDVRSTENLDEARARTLLDEEFKKKLRATPTARMSAVELFELVDFCVTNGLNWRVTELLDQAMTKDKNLLQSIRTNKARRLYNAFYFFLQNGKVKDAEDTLNILKKRYASAIKVDKEDEEMLAAAKNKPIVTNRPTDRPKPPDKESPKPPDNNSPPPPEKEQPKPPDKEQPRPQGKEPSPFDNDNTPVNGGNGSTPQPVNPVNSQHKEMIDLGDEKFAEGMRHLKASDPNQYRDADKQNLEAEKLFREALGYYEKAQKISDSKYLQGQIREAMSLRSMCRKRAILSKQ